LIAADDANNNFELGSGGSELVITNKNEKGTRVRTLGSREFIRYYRQKPRPSVATDRALALSLASRYEHLRCPFRRCLNVHSVMECLAFGLASYI
jgi:pre-60S factor REI1